MRATVRLLAVALLLAPGAALAQQPDLVRAVKRPPREAPAAPPPLDDALVQRYQRAALRALERSEHRELLARNLSGANGARLSALGIARLGPDQLERRARLRLVLMEQADERTCAAWSMGRATSDQVVPVLARADSAVLDGWLDLALAAAAAELRREPERATYEPDDVLRLFQRVGDRLPATDRKRFWRVLDALEAERASDAAACWLDRTVYRELLALQPDERAAALRTLIAVESDPALRRM